MNFNKKYLIISLFIIVMLTASACSNAPNDKAAQNTSSSAIASSSNNKVDKKNNSESVDNSNITIDEDIKKIYDDFIKTSEEEIKNIPNKNELEMAKKWLDKAKENIPMFMELHQKAKNNCSKGFYVEGNTINSKDNNFKHTVKTFFSNGDSRQEEYRNDKLTYLSIYSKEQDTFYSYNVAKDTLQKTTKYSKKHKGDYPYKFGFFDAFGNELTGDIKYIDYEGKKVLYSDDKDGSKYWYDVETGIILKSEETFLKSNTVNPTYTTNYTIEFNKTYDKEMFTFDKNKLITEINTDYANTFNDLIWSNNSRFFSFSTYSNSTNKYVGYIYDLHNEAFKKINLIDNNGPPSIYVSNDGTKALITTYYGYSYNTFSMYLLDLNKNIFSINKNKKLATLSQPHVQFLDSDKILFINEQTNSLSIYNISSKEIAEIDSFKILS